MQEMGRTKTSFGLAQYIKVRTEDYRRLSWEELWDVFVDRYPDRWAVQFFPPRRKVVNEVNIYHLYVLDIDPTGVSIHPSDR